MQTQLLDHERIARLVYEAVQSTKDSAIDARPKRVIGIFEPVINPQTKLPERFTFVWCPDDDVCR